MNDSASSPSSMFRQLLPTRFEALPPTVRTLHERQGCHRYRGKAEVERGRHPLARCCAWATRLPRAGRGPVEVEIDAHGDSERWTRLFSGRAMRSRLRAHGELLRERLGLVTFGFRLDVDDPPGLGPSLRWRVVQVRVLGLPLPSRWFVGVIAREYERDHRYRFEVAATLPGLGLLVHYRGWLDVR